jgi:hypothetical protein
MKKYVFSAIVVLTILTITISTATAGGAGGGRGGAAGGMGGGGMGGGRGAAGGGMPAVSMQRPNKTARLASIAEIEKQIAALRTAIQKAPATDPCIPQLQPEALTTFTAQYNEESTALTQIVTAINTLRAGGRGGAGSLTTEVIAELTKLATEEKATKLVSRLEAVAKETTAQAGRGGGMGGGRGGTFTPPAGGFKYND